MGDRTLPDGIYVGDRTLPDLSRKFMPRPDNIIEIPSIDTIFENNLTEWEWAAFGGTLPWSAMR